jgi:Domain of unknown function DUF11
MRKLEESKMHTEFDKNVTKLTGLLAEKRGLKGTGAALLLSALVIYSGLTIAWAPYSGPYHASSNPYSSLSPASLEPDIAVNAYCPQTVTYGQIFNLTITARNVGNAPASNVHVLYRASPPGFFIVQNVDQPSCAVSQDSEDVNLGTLGPNASRDISFMLQVPTQAQLAGVWSQNFRFDFTTTYDKSVISYAGCVELIIRHGQLLLSKQGFSQ